MKDKAILVTGGSGSLGREIVRQLVEYHDCKKVVVFSRSEYPQVEMEQRLEKSRVRYFLGDIRDRERLRVAFDRIDYVLHLAAIKHIDKCLYNPREAVTINVMGAVNVADIAMERKVEKVLCVSTDKAVSPTNLYGATKLTADEYMLAAQVYNPNGTKFSVIRLGNLWGSRGSVIPKFKNMADEGCKELPIHDMRATRFFVMIEDAARLVIEALQEMKGGEIFSPKLEAYRISDLAREMFPDCDLQEVGMNPDEKLHEHMLSGCQGKTHDCGKWFVTCDYWKDGELMPRGFVYSSTGL